MVDVLETCNRITDCRRNGKAVSFSIENNSFMQLLADFGDRFSTKQEIHQKIKDSMKDLAYSSIPVSNVMQEELFSSLNIQEENMKTR